ncbi:MAG: hemolysin III family protein [Flavobacteriaceae bacterium]|nr:hemolysin III family protein [Flavobacteriaceae bacterium]
MKPKKAPKSYEPLEEKLNVYSHGLGLLLSIAALVLLVVKASIDGSPWRIVSFSIFGVSMIVLYTASTVFHNAKDPIIRKRLNIFDHASIYVLIAGSYTPFTLVTLNGTLGWVLFGISWGIAITGIILKLFYTGKYEKASTIAYVLMGWMIVFAIKPLIANLASEGLLWLVWGGISYTVGAVLYSINKLKFNHIIFHIFVLIGSFCHFMVVYSYV